ncbi:MAG: IS630 family transposase, partial [Desulfobulbaceae bacterium]|nr:IS630 family transposase [Desulfobulbaceae bacterium]MCJ7602327.1 IS630 family transposase [Desulfobulbaceae bacterium]MCJ7602389.1 IS630 family transposase [Desulfobulbaceae bacterium]MCJ7603632.1 IS630 family transposase [Desulfobulbaceae bacterium]
TMQAEVAAWENDRNNGIKKIDWQFTTSDARVKLKRLYPKL